MLPQGWEAAMVNMMSGLQWSKSVSTRTLRLLFFFLADWLMDKSRGWSQKVLPECPVQCTYDPLKILQVISLLICRSEKEETTSVMSCWHWGWISLL